MLKFVILKRNPWQKKFSVTYYQTLKDVFWPLRLERREERKINVKKLKKIARFVLKISEKCWNLSTTTRNYAVTYYKTLEEVSWQKTWKKTEKWQKKSKNSIKLRVFSDQLFVSSQRGGGGGHRGRMGRGEGGVGSTGMWGNVVGVGVNSGVSSTSKNRPSHHKYKSPKQFELKQSWRNLRAFNARSALPVYPVFEDEMSKVSDKRIGQAKNRTKKRSTGLI